MSMGGGIAIAPDQQPPAEPPNPELDAGVLRRWNIAFARPLGYRPLLLDLHTPADTGPCPLVVHIYGGAFATGSHKHSSLGDYLVPRLLGEGFAVAAVQYRHSKEAPFPAQLHDVKAAIRWLRHHGPALGVDKNRVAAWGSSSGGHLAAMLAATGDSHPHLQGEVGLTGPSSAVAAAISWSAPVNIALLPPPPPESQFHQLGQDPHDWLLGAPVYSVPNLAALASTSTYPTASSAPLLLAHGERDTAIPIEQSEELLAAYFEVGAAAELVRVPGAGHFFDEADREHLVTLGLRFLRSHLN